MNICQLWAIRHRGVVGAGMVALDGEGDPILFCTSESAARECVAAQRDRYGADVVAWSPIGWRPAFFADVDPFASAVLAERWPGVANLGDITAADLADRARAQLDGRPLFALEAGTPCQAFSIIGRRASLDDARGRLALAFVRVADELNPEWIVWENVAGVLALDDNAFGHVLAGLVGVADPLPCGLRHGRWPRAGVVVGPARAVAWRVFDAQYFGLAQRRRRVFVVGRRAGNGAAVAAVLFEPESRPRHPAPRGRAGAYAAGTVAGGPGNGGGGLFDVSGPDDGGEPPRPGALAYGGNRPAVPRRRQRHPNYRAALDWRADRRR